MAFSRELIPRLTYAKQMYLHAYDHGKNPGFLNKTFSIISIDGAIERFLWTIVTEFNASSKLPKRPHFHDVWKAADDAVGNKLPLKSEVEKIHDIRNLAQHQGTVPSERDIESSLIYAEDYLSKACLACFNIDFNQILLSDLIIDPYLQAQLKKIEIDISKKDYELATKEAVIAFEMLKNKYKQFYSEKGFERRPFMIMDFVHSIHDWEDSSEKVKTKKRTLENIFVSLLDEIDRINDRIYAISLGANMQDYLFFRKNTPRATFSTKGFKFDYAEPIIYSEEKMIKIFNFLYNLTIHWESLKT